MKRNSHPSALTRSGLHHSISAIYIAPIIFLRPPRGAGFSNQQKECHLAGVYGVPRAGLEARLCFFFLSLALSMYNAYISEANAPPTPRGSTNKNTTDTYYC